ncbi:hypothetical protein GTV15_08470, partial [Streptomyces sp. SID7803]|nr:hypothetical protein [Streptomyces sp. SID7803]
MRSEEYDWKTEEFGASHQGRPGAVLADGAEPKPVTFDLGSGTNVHETSNWWVYDGNTLAPHVRPRCGGSVLVRLARQRPAPDRLG